MRPAINLISTDSFAEGHPWAQYAWLRVNAPVYRHPDGDGKWFWALTKYDDVRTVSRQPQLFSSYARGVMVGDPPEEDLIGQRQMMLSMDPPQHERYRRLVSRGFTPRQAQHIGARVEALAREIVDDVADRGECDLVVDVAGRLPSGLIAELMGIPRSDGERLYELTEIMHTTDESVVSAERRTEAIHEMFAYAAEVAATKRAHAQDDIASTLVRAEIDGSALTDEEFQWFFLLLVNAGGDTTRNLVAAGMQLLFEHPEQRARLQADPEHLMAPAVEEMLRYSSPVAHFQRTAMSDMAIRGVDIAAGDRLAIFYGSANRDEDVFAQSDRFDVTRDPNPHLAFGGGGAHLCLGMHVARVEIAALVRELITRLPDMAPAGPSQRLASSFIVGYHSLPVKFTPARQQE
jgi:cytochrome P450